MLFRNVIVDDNKFKSQGGRKSSFDDSVIDRRVNRREEGGERDRRLTRASSTTKSGRGEKVAA